MAVFDSMMRRCWASLQRMPKANATRLETSRAGTVGFATATGCKDHQAQLALAADGLGGLGGARGAMTRLRISPG